MVNFKNKSATLANIGFFGIIIWAFISSFFLLSESIFGIGVIFFSLISISSLFFIKNSYSRQKLS